MTYKALLRDDGVEFAVSWLRPLALRVIHQAFRDADGRDGSTHSKEARAFLAGSTMLDFWCEVARVESRHVTRRALALQTAAGPG